MTNNVEVYPLIMEPSFRYGQSTPWGGHALKEKYGKHAPEEITGESLEISALPGHESRVTNGAYRGRSLREIFATELPDKIIQDVEDATMRASRNHGARAGGTDIQALLVDEIILHITLPLFLHDALVR